MNPRKELLRSLWELSMGGLGFRVESPELNEILTEGVSKEGAV